MSDNTFTSDQKFEIADYGAYTMGGDPMEMGKTYGEIMKALVMGQGLLPSEQIREGANAGGIDVLSGNVIIIPPEDLNALAACMDLSSRLSRCVRTFARNVCGFGWCVKPKTLINEDTPDDERERVEEQSKKIRRILYRPNMEMSFTRLMELVCVDEEAVGNGYIEVVRNPAGEISSLYHVPGRTVRILKTGEGYVQVRENQHKFFKMFRDERQMNAETGEFSNSVPRGKRATELIHFKIDSVRSSWYGIPRWFPTIPAIAGNKFAAIRNVSFFENDAPQPVDSKVLTPTGWVRMGDIRVGDQVIGRDGLGHAVTEILEGGEQDIYRVRFMDEAYADCALNHVWEVTNNYDRQRGVSRQMSLREIIDDGFFYDSGPAKWAVPLARPTQFEASDDPPIDPYLLGLLLGDGYFSGDCVTLAAAIDDADEVQGYIEKMIPDMRITRRDRRRYSEDSGVTEFGLRKAEGVYRNPLRTALDDLGLLGKKGAEKFIPEIYLRSSVENRVSVLQGLIDSDGHVGKTNGGTSTFVRFTTISMKLARGLCDLVGSLGGTATIRPVKDRTTFNVTVKQLPPGIVPARLKRKADAYEPTAALRHRTMVAAERTRSAEVRCLRIDSDDALYVTDNYVVTHNCPRLLVTVIGGKLLPKSVELMRQFFELRGKGSTNAHRVCVLQAEPRRPGAGPDSSKVQINVEKLTVGVEDEASFRHYQEANNEEIREAFGIARIFFAPSGSNRANSVIERQITNEQEFEPARIDKEYCLNNGLVLDILSGGLQAEPIDPDEVLVEFEFKRPRVTYPSEQAEIHRKYAAAGVFTPNEIRQQLGHPPFPKTHGFAEKPVSIALTELQVSPAMARAGLKPLVGEFVDQRDGDGDNEAPSATEPPQPPSNDDEMDDEDRDEAKALRDFLEKNLGVQVELTFKKSK